MSKKGRCKQPEVDDVGRKQQANVHRRSCTGATAEF